MKIAYISSEVAGFAKTGGLADVGAALPRALAQRGHECIVVMPLYRCIRRGKVIPEPTKLRVNIPIRHHVVTGSVWRATLPHSEVPVYMIAQPKYFERDDPKKGTTFYQYTRQDGKRMDYEDNCERYSFFCRAALELLRLLDFWPEVLHCNDWHTGLVPVYLKENYRHHFTPAFRPLYRAIRSLFTIHNIAYQGLFPAEEMETAGLPWHLFNLNQLEFYGRLNFLKAGLVFSDLITAVSPTYATEIQTPTYGCGLHGVLYERRDDLYGIVNGVDYGVWNPATDKHVAANYEPDSVQKGKAACKRALQKKMGLPLKPKTPLIGMISRLTSQKGLDLIREGGAELLQQDVQLVVLGEGETAYKEMLMKLHKRFPKKCALKFAHDEALAHEIEAGVDMFLMPSLFEPCGLNQLYSLKYGTVPIVRKTGGLADTVTDATVEALQAKAATGFAFTMPTPLALLGAVQRALICYHKQPAYWLQMMHTGMAQDWSWDKSAARYEGLYEQMVNEE